MALNDEINGIFKGYLSDCEEYAACPRVYNSQIMDNWKTDFLNMNPEDKKALYSRIDEKRKFYADNEFYGIAAILRDALKNLQI